MADTSSQERAIAHPVGSRLLDIARYKVVGVAMRAGIALKQTCAKEGTRLTVESDTSYFQPSHQTSQAHLRARYHHRPIQSLVQDRMSRQRALLLTDVVESTRLAEELGDAATASLWAAHDRIARDLLPAWRGREIDKTDGMLLLFDGAADALGYAIAYQDALSSLAPRLKARVGLHVGPVTLRKNSQTDVARGAKPIEVDGAAKAVAARVMSVALGGQILLSAPAQQAVAEGDTRLQSHGHWRLKGIAEPVELFEAGHADSCFIPPPDAEKAYRVVRQGDLWLPAREIPHSLPAERDGFVGRVQALAELARRIQSGTRLVSVLGIGGTGKTRLVTRFGWTWLGDFSGGVWFCDLAQARSVDGIVHAVASALDVPLDKDDPVVQLGHAIAGRGPCLVILDNFEQVARHAEKTLAQWLDRAGDAQFIVTSREVLGLAGEEALALPPLPPVDAALLFKSRAEAALSDDRTSVDDEAIAQLVELLDGLPLAIELAAARVGVLAPRALLARMDERFKLLSSAGARGDRQSTLRASLDWSWELLSATDKAALAQLSVFEGGFTLHAAEGVLDLSGCDEVLWPVDAVQSLVDKSFVRPQSNERFSLLVSVQEYAAEHLRTEGRFSGSGMPALRVAQRRHCAYFAALDRQRAAADGSAELDNLVVACRRAVSAGDTRCATGALQGAWVALHLRGPFQVGVELAESVLTMSACDARDAAQAERVLASALSACGRWGEAGTHFDAALSLARSAGDRPCEAEVAIGLGALLEHEGRVQDARAQYLRAQNLAREFDEVRLECHATNGLGNVALAEGQSEVALSHYERGLLLAREVGDRRMEGDLLGNIGNVHVEIGRMDEGLARTEEACAIAREIGYRQLEGNTLCNLGMLQLVQGRFEKAAVSTRAALAVARELGYVLLECVVRCNLGIVAERQGQAEQAQAHFDDALRIVRALGYRRMEGQFLGYQGLLHARQRRSQEAQRCLEAGEGLLRAARDPVGLGVLLCSRAEAHHLAGDDTAAASVLVEAEGIAVEVSAGPSSELGLAIARARESIVEVPRA